MDSTARAEWRGLLKDGLGTVALESGSFQGNYSFDSRFASGEGTTPEELIAAAHAACFSMAFSKTLQDGGAVPELVQTSARVSLEKQGEGFAVTRIHLDTQVQAAGIDDEKFQSLAEKAKRGCPISKLLASADISLSATLQQMQKHTA